MKAQFPIQHGHGRGLIRLGWGILASAGLLLSGAVVPAMADSSDTVQAGTLELGDDDITIRFSASGAATSADFAVEASTTLASDSWEPVAATITSLGVGEWEAEFPRLDVGREFFRITRNGVPITTSLGAPTATLREGESGGITVQFTAPYSGPLSYTIDFGDGSGPQAGSIQVSNATSATIPVTVPDDDSADLLQALTLSLGGEGGSYNLGNITTTSITVEDNDSIWVGALFGGNDKIGTPIELHLTEQAGQTTAVLAPSQFGMFPAKEDGWPATLTLTPTEFSGTVADMMIPGEKTIYQSSTLLTLSLNPNGGGTVTENKLEGEFSITTSIPALPHLTPAERSGTFLLFRKPGTGAGSEPTEDAPPLVP